jgi:hypothetical protein
MYGRTGLVCLLTCTLFSAAFGSDAANQFCGVLQSSHAVPLGPFGLFYKDATGAAVPVLDGMSIPRVDSFFYYVRAETSQYGRPSLLNIKMVVRTGQKIANRRYVYVRNNLWRNYSSDRQAQISRDCSAVDPQGYEDFHLGTARDYCLQKHFHQTVPIDTLATQDSRRSFAFQDMLSSDRPDLVASVFSWFSPSPALAGDSAAPTSISDIRSWIKNFQFSQSADNCVEIKPYIPSAADRLHIRVTFHGTDVFGYLDGRDWHLTFSK